MSQHVARGTVDAAGRLVTADPALDALNTRAGGSIGATMAVLPLGSVARLARRLGVVVARPVTVGDDDADIDLWVRAQPLGDQVRLTLSGWRAQRPWPAAGEAERDEAQGWPWEVDAALRLTHVGLSSAAREGLALADLLGQPLTALFTLQPDANGGLPLVEALARRVALVGQRARVSGGWQPVLLDARVRHDAAGIFAGFSGTARPDFAAPRTDPIDEDFTQGLDRALRRSLTLIVAQANSIHAAAEGPLAREYVDYAADIAGAGRHLLGLIDDLTDMKAIEQPGFVIQVEQIDLADLARRAAGLLTVRANDAGVTIARPDPSMALSASGDFRRVLQILVNLVGNAIRFAPRGSEVTVGVELVEGMPTVTITDQGRGIAAADAERVFEKFERVDPGESGGSGLGLYIARRLARAMNGDLMLDSTPGQGARFTLRLPPG